MVTLTQTTNKLFNKWAIGIGALLLIYFMGGFDIITKNPAILVFVALGIIIIYSMRSRQK